MKKNLLLVILFLCIGLISFSQAPQSIPYQAVARDASGNLLQNTTICVQYRVYNAATGGTLLYEEHQQATTNKLGLFSVNVGTGSYDGGSSLTLGGINWGSNAVYVEIGLDVTGGCTGSNTYTNMGRNQMMSVPFALYAGSAASASGAAGGDLTGNYPNPNLVAIGTAGTYGNALTYPVVTVDSKGRVTNVTTDALPVVGFTNGAGISVTGTYPNFTIANTAPSSGGTVTSITASSPLTGGTITGSGTVACPTCVTSSGGGAMTGTSPITVSAAGAIACPTCLTGSSGTYILNQTSQQSGSNFNISGDGTIGGNAIVSGTVTAGQAIMGTSINGGYYQDGTNGAYRSILPSTSTNGFYFQTNAGTASTMYVGLGGTYNGHVGIGTITPGIPLDVTGTSTIGIRYIKTGAVDARISVGDNSNNVWSWACGWGADNGGANGGAAGDFSLLHEGISGDVFYVQAATNNVGIGTVTPAYSLDVTSTFRVSSPTRTLTPSGGGGDVSVAGGFTYISYTQSGTFTLPAGLSSLAVEVLVVGGGGGGGTNGGGGGGAGQIIDQSGTITGNATITVGIGGQGALGVSNNAPGLQGGTSSFAAAGFTTVTAFGGGGGATRVGSGNSSAGGGAGYGSGGGGSSVTTTGGAAGGGFAGGAGFINSSTGCFSTGGGGGGAGAAGTAGVSLTPGTGGAGKTYTDFPSPLGVSGFFGGGGGGGVTCAEGGATPSGGSGGGGSGSNGGSSGGNGTPGTGSGGGGGGQQGSGYNGGDGGSGIVIIRYSNSTTYTPSSSQPTIIATAGGNVGIGTSTPQYNLQVAGTFQASSIATTIYTNSATNTGHFQVTASCGAGGTLISGGCYDNADDIYSETGTSAISMSYPMNSTTWRCGSRDITTAQTRTLTAYAICTQ